MSGLLIICGRLGESGLRIIFGPNSWVGGARVVLQAGGSFNGGCPDGGPGTFRGVSNCSHPLIPGSGVYTCENPLIFSVVSGMLCSLLIRPAIRAS